ncbi:MAG: GNAT family N-acetyltransferase [Phycisphaerae bacterium]|nr:GNAT family N-acetyltransferase [Phycisphaerae bacterium]
MRMSPFCIELLGDHDRGAFDCGVAALNDYLRRLVTQDIRRNVTACYVAVEIATHRIAGYYTLAATGIPLTDLPAAVIRRLPRYPSVPAVRIGRLAIDCGYQGRRLGGSLLFDAIDRTRRSGIAAFAVVVDAKSEQAAEFYEHHGFVRFASQPMPLFLPIASAPRTDRA